VNNITNLKRKIFKKTFVNYFSLGYDARVGFGIFIFLLNYIGVDKIKSTTRCWNKVLYCWEGIKKMCCSKSITVNGFIDSFLVVKDEKEKAFNEFEGSIIESDKNNVTVLENKAPKEVIFQDRLSKVTNAIVSTNVNTNNNVGNIINTNLNTNINTTANINVNANNMNKGLQALQNDKNSNCTIFEFILKMIR